MTAGYKPTDEDGLAEAWGEADRAALTPSHAPAVPSDVLSEMREFGQARMAEFMGAHHMALVLSQKINEWADKLTAAPTPAQAPAVPGGWKLVPVEPTQEMLATVTWPECARTDWMHMLTAAPTPPAQGEKLVRFCPGCGSVGDVPDTFRDCCPDGSNARMIPEDLATRCHDLFLLALDGAKAQQPAVPEDVARNAERYRWLRDMASQDWLHRNHNYQNLRGAAFDAAIDAARAAEKGGA